MSLVGGQPRTRFAGKYLPGDIAGLSYLPKIITVTKDITSTETDEVIFAAPAGTFIARVVAVCTETTHSTDLALEVGLDGNPDAFIDASDFTLETVGNWATNIGSTAADNATGLYLAAADNVTLDITGSTVTDGQVQIMIEFFEFAEMFAVGGVHVEL